jgi:hypothetical protein
MPNAATVRVATAQISGVTPCRSMAHICMGKVFSVAVSRNVIATSSKLNVKTSKALPMIAPCVYRYCVYRYMVDLPARCGAKRLTHASSPRDSHKHQFPRASASTWHPQKSV